MSTKKSSVFESFNTGRVKKLSKHYNYIKLKYPTKNDPIINSHIFHTIPN